MNWLLIITKAIYKVNGEMELDIVFTNPDNSIHKTFSTDTDIYAFFESNIIEFMNFHVAVKDHVYVVCNIRSDVYEQISQRFPQLVKRVRDTIDLGSFAIMKRILCK